MLENLKENKGIEKMLSIVMPAYNEEKRLGKTLEAYSNYFNLLLKKKLIEDFEILVVLNGCKDRTLEIVKDYMKKNKKIKYLNFEESGKGFAVIQGFKDALKRADLIGFVDADCSTSPEAFYDLVKKIGNYDGVIASRYLKNAVVNPKPSMARIISARMFNYLTRFLFLMSYKDTQCGAKLFRKNVIKEIINNLGITKWAFDVDLLYNLKKKGFKVKEIPTIWSDKKYSKINFLKAGPFMALAIIRLRLLNSWFKDLIRFYDKLPEFIKLHHKIK